jgi:glycosyltransferase involved in cell wall biosynthesis
MMRKKTFVTIFPICENVHLTTDLGQIPYFMYKMHGYDAKIATYKNNENYPSLDGEVKGLNIDFIKDTGRISFLERGVLKYIRKNAKNIDVLNLYHFSKFTFVYGILYKILNPKGFLFVKLDGYNETFAEGNEILHSTKKIKHSILKVLEKIFLKKVDLISIENTEGERLVKLMFKSITSKILYLPVGVNDLFLSQNFDTRLKKFQNKENIILSLGRIGEKIKNHEMILRALLKANIKDWKIVFAGPVNPEFMDYFNTLVVEHPSLKSKVIFTGKITDRIELYEWYNRSKIFCMTSWNESFCHAIGEAFYFGNYIIGTEGIMSMKDITNNGKYGVTLKPDDDKALATTFQKLIDDDSQVSVLYPDIVDFSRKYFTWSQIIGRLQAQIESNK